MKYFIYVTMVGMLMNTFQLLLPAINIKKVWQRLLFLPLVPLGFLHPYGIYVFFFLNLMGNALLFITNNISKPIWINRLLLTILGLSGPSWAYFKIRLLSSEAYELYYLLAYLSVIFWTYWAWELLRNLQSYQKSFRKILIILVSLSGLSFVTVWGCIHNPTVYGHRESLSINDKTRTYKNEEILTLLKQVQTSVAIKIVERYKDVKTIEFTSIQRVLYNETSLQGEVKINNSDTSFDYSIDFSNPSEPFRLSGVYPDKALQTKKEERDPIIKWGTKDLDDPEAQKKLENVDVIYYQKNDIYKLD